VLDADTDLFAFESPSGNIDCLISAGNDPPFVECDLGGVTWSVPRPADCDLDWGGGEDGSGRVSLSVDGEAGAVCAGDITVGPDAPVMVPYGQAVWLGEELVCRSSEAGMRCESLLSSSGFQVSRAAFDVF